MFDVIIIGGGPAGLAAARKCCEEGLEKILIIERDSQLGGILNQCIHTGFGVGIFHEELSGPEFAHKYIEMLKGTRVEVMLDTMVLEINKDKEVTIINHDGYQKLRPKPSSWQWAAVKEAGVPSLPRAPEEPVSILPELLRDTSTLTATWSAKELSS